MARKQPRALVAAATRLRIERTLTGTIPTETWQQAMWGIYDETPEVWYGLNYKRAVASKMRYFAAEISDDPEAEPVATENQQAVELVEALNEGQGIAQMAGESMLHLDVAGEEYVIGRDVEGEGDEEDETVWAVYSPGEAAQDQKLQRDLNPEVGKAVAYRIWRPHPNNGSKPDSPLRASKDVAEELWYTAAAGRAQAKSRLGAGILFLAQEMKLAQDEQANPNDSIADELGGAMIVPIKDPESAAAVAPIIIEGPRDMVGQGQGWDYLDLAREWTDLGPREERLIRRLAAGIDLPAELILGMGEMNHWGAWLADESSIKSHVDPTVQLFLDGITRAYLHPALQEAGMGRDEARRFLIWRDFANVVQHPDRGKSSLELYDRAELSGEALRQANGFSAEDAPTPEEREIIRQNVGTTTTELIDASSTERGAPASAVTAAAGMATLDGLADIDQHTLDLLTEAVEAAVQKAMERAGARLRNQTRKDKILSDQIAGTDNRIVAMRLTQRVALQLVPEGELLSEDDFVQLGEQASRILGRAQVSATVELERLGAVAADVDVRKGWLSRAVETLVRTTIALTLRRLFTPSPDPDPVETGETGDVAVPAADVWNVMTIAGGGEPGTFQPDTPRGVALGPDVRSRLAEAGYQTEAYEWRYGDAPRRTNFPPHLALGGTRFTSWTDDRLQSHTFWLAVTHYYPGDHRGCRCVAVPVVELTAP